VILLVTFGCATQRGSIRGSLEPKTLGPDAVVMAWPAGGASEDASSERARVRQTAKGFEPHVTSVAPGGTVVFDNEDRVYHNAFCVQPDGRFDTGSYAPGQTRSVKLKKAGVYRVFCELHPKESAYVVVSPDRWHTRPEPDGRFAFEDLPPGKYKIRVWRPEQKDLLGSVEVKPKTKEPATVKFDPAR
jgi:plastocyanin